MKERHDLYKWNQQADFIVTHCCASSTFAVLGMENDKEDISNCVRDGLIYDGYIKKSSAVMQGSFWHFR